MRKFEVILDLIKSLFTYTRVNGEKKNFAEKRLWGKSITLSTFGKAHAFQTLVFQITAKFLKSQLLSDDYELLC